jgi:hypothetical protein
MESQDTLNVKDQFHSSDRTYVNVSIAPKSKYVKIYKELLKALVEDRKTRESSQLSVEDCEFIRYNLPSSHCVVNKDKYYGFYYDHLFVKYFIMNKNYTYDHKYIAYGTDIFLYLQLYNCIKRKQQKARYMSSSSSLLFEKDNLTTEDLLDDNINNFRFAKSEISMRKIMENLCEDIKAILYMRLTIEQYEKVKINLRVLQYVVCIYKIAKFSNVNVKDITLTDSDDPDILYISGVIIDIANYTNLFVILQCMYEKIKTLYEIFQTKHFNKYSYYNIYSNSESCHKNIDPITLEKFDDNYFDDDGRVSILPYYKEDTRDNINDYHCYFTEGLYKYINFKTTTNQNPKTRQALSQNEMNYIRENMRLLQDKNKNVELKIKIDSRFTNLFLFLNDSDKNIPAYEIQHKPHKLEIIGSYSLWLGINLGSIEMPIHFKLLSVDYSHILPIPIFNSMTNNNNIIELLKKINDNGFVPSSLSGSIVVKKEVFLNSKTHMIVKSIYDAVVKNLTKISKSRAQDGGKKKTKKLR